MTTYNVATVTFIAVNIVLSVTLVLINKRIVIAYDFRFMTLLSGLHFIASFLACLILTITGLLKYKTVNSYASIFKISVVT